MNRVIRRGVTRTETTFPSKYISGRRGRGKRAKLACNKEGRNEHYGSMHSDFLNDANVGSWDFEDRARIRVTPSAMVVLGGWVTQSRH